MRQQTKIEDYLNTITHALGAVVSVFGLVLLLLFNTNKTPYSTFSLVVYGLSLIVLFSASAIYHAVSSKNYTHKHKQSYEHWCRVFDHISIYFLIAGTYTPVLLITLYDTSGVMLLKIIWGLAGFGMLLKLFYIDRFEWFSIALYLIMGWLIVVDYRTFEGLIGNGKYYLFAGGFFYTVGVVFYAVNAIPFNHVIWHILVLLGALSHFIMIFKYVI